MLAGAAKEYSAEMDAKKQRAADILLAQQKYLMESGLKKLQDIRDARKESQARISKAKTFGFDSKAALALEMSGQLESLITRLTKLDEDPDKDISRKNINKMSKAILENVPPEKLAQAMEYALDSGAGEEVTAEKLINAIFSATTPSEVGEAASMIGDISGESLPSVGPFGLNLISLTEFTPEKKAQAEKLIERQLAPLLGFGGMTNEGGRTVFNWTNPSAAGRIVNKALEYYTERRADPYLDVDIGDITDDITNKVNSLLLGGATLDQIATQYDFSTNTADFNVEPITTGDENENNISNTSNVIAPPSFIIDNNILNQ
tara:strand:- start:4560 stop:5516 length:957 start_codon:yes stop_codon:yes gene_type:complete